MIFIAEGALAMRMICSTEARRQRQAKNHPYYVSNESSNCFQVATGTSLESKLADEIENIDGVRDVRVNRNGAAFSVDIDLLNFDKASRRRVYAKEKDLYREFPNYTFNFCLIDASGTTTANALNG